MKEKYLTVLVCVVCSMVCRDAAGVNFSFDIPSPGIAPPPSGDSIHSPGGAVPPTPPAVAPPPVVLAGSGLLIEVDAFSYAHPHFVPSGANFSVSPFSAGAAGSAVAIEAASGDEPADIYFSGFMGTNIQTFDGDGSTAPPLGLPEPAASNLDGLDMTIAPPVGSIYWSVDPVTIGGVPPYAAAAPSDIFVAPTAPGFAGAPIVWAPAPALGLVVADDVNALFLMESGDGIAGTRRCCLFFVGSGISHAGGSWRHSRRYSDNHTRRCSGSFRAWRGSWPRAAPDRRPQCAAHGSRADIHLAPPAGRDGIDRWKAALRVQG